MSGPIFNKNLCLGCGICAADCSMIILETKGKGNVPIMAFPDICLQCGHCIAVCPNGAVSHPDLNMSNFNSIDLLPNSDAVKMLLSSKRSVRQFSKKPIEKETIEELVQTACMAPSDLNSQNREFIVLTDQKKVKELEYAIVEGFKIYVKNALKSGESANSPQIIISQNIIYQYKNGGFPIFKNAPCVIFVCGPKQEQELFAPINAVTANTYLMIQAHSMGIGSCIIGRALYNTEFLSNYFKISSELKIYTAITLGYPKVKYRKTVDRTPHNITWI